MIRARDGQMPHDLHFLPIPRSTTLVQRHILALSSHAAFSWPDRSCFRGHIGSTKTFIHLPFFFSCLSFPKPAALNALSLSLSLSQDSLSSTAHSLSLSRCRCTHTPAPSQNVLVLLHTFSLTLNLSLDTHILSHTHSLSRNTHTHTHT